MTKNDIDLIKHCDNQFLKHKQELEIKKLSQDERYLLETKKKIGVAFQSMMVERQTKLDERKELDGKCEQIREQDKNDYERSTWWMECESSNAKMRNWVDKQD